MRNKPPYQSDNCGFARGGSVEQAKLPSLLRFGAEVKIISASACRFRRSCGEMTLTEQIFTTSAQKLQQARQSSFLTRSKRRQTDRAFSGFPAEAETDRVISNSFCHFCAEVKIKDANACRFRRFGAEVTAGKSGVSGFRIGAESNDASA